MILLMHWIIRNRYEYKSFKEIIDEENYMCYWQGQISIPLDRICLFFALEEQRY